MENTIENRFHQADIGDIFIQYSPEEVRQDPYDRPSGPEHAFFENCGIVADHQPIADYTPRREDRQ